MGQINVCNENHGAKEELMKVLYKSKHGKAAEVDGITIEFLYKIGDSADDFVVTIFSVCTAQSEVLEDLWTASGNKSECLNYRSKSQRSIPNEAQERAMIGSGSIHRVSD